MFVLIGVSVALAVWYVVVSYAAADPMALSPFEPAARIRVSPLGLTRVGSYQTFVLVDLGTSGLESRQHPQRLHHGSRAHQDEGHGRGDSKRAVVVQECEDDVAGERRG